MYDRAYDGDYSTYDAGGNPVSTAAAAPAAKGLSSIPNDASSFYRNANTGVFVLGDGSLAFTNNGGTARGWDAKTGAFDLSDAQRTAIDNSSFGGDLSTSWTYRDAFNTVMEGMNLTPESLSTMFSSTAGGGGGGFNFSADLTPVDYSDMLRYEKMLETQARDVSGAAMRATGAEAFDKAAERAQATTSQQLKAGLEANRVRGAAMGVDPNSAKAQALNANMALDAAKMGVSAQQQAFDSQTQQGLNLRNAAMQAWQQTGAYAAQRKDFETRDVASQRSLTGQLAGANAQVAAAQANANANVAAAGIRARSDMYQTAMKGAFDLYKLPHDQYVAEGNMKANLGNTASSAMTVLPPKPNNGASNFMMLSAMSGGFGKTPGTTGGGPYDPAKFQHVAY